MSKEKIGFLLMDWVREIDNDRLDTLFRMQKEFQTQLKNGKKIYRKKDVDFDFFREQTIGLIDELMESYREIPSKDKPWKRNQQFNQEKMKEEIIDCWHYLINLSMAAGMNSNDVFKLFLYKHSINRKRTK